MTLSIVAALFLIASILLLVMTIRCCRRRQWLRGSVNASLTLSMVALSIALILLASNLYSYQRLSYEQHLANIHIENLSQQRHQLTLEIPQQEPKQFEIVGDDWQIDARVLKWHPYANLLGLDLQYQLERLSGRFTNIAQEKSESRSVYALNTNNHIDVWRLARRHPDWLPFVDAVYGSAAYVPLADGADYQLFATQNGLIIRASNNQASRAVTNWR